MKRVPIRAILKSPKQRRELCIRSIMTIQAREGIDTSYAQAADAYDRVRAEQRGRCT